MDTNLISWCFKKKKKKKKKKIKKKTLRHLPTKLNILSITEFIKNVLTN